MKCIYFSVTAPVYDQDTTQVAEYDGGTYAVMTFITSNLINVHARYRRREVNCSFHRSRTDNTCHFNDSILSMNIKNVVRRFNLQYHIFT